MGYYIIIILKYCRNFCFTMILGNYEKILNVLSKSSGLSIDELEKKVEEILDKAIKRARANNRRTIQARDL